MPYDIKDNYSGCNGYAVVGPSGILGCHKTMSDAINQQKALYAAENSNKSVIDNTITPNKYPKQIGRKRKKKMKKEMSPEDLYGALTPEEKAYHDALVRIKEAFGPFDQGTSSIWVGYESPSENEDADIGVKCGNCAFHYDIDGGGLGCKLLSFQVEEDGKCRLAAIPDGIVDISMDGEMSMDEEDLMNDDITQKATSVSVGDMVSWNSSGGTARGKVLRVIRDGKYNVPNSDFVITGTPDDPAVAIRVYRNGKPTDIIVGHKMKTLRKGSFEFNLSKAEDTFTPTSGMKAAANRALKWKEDGKATGAGTPIGWGRASDIVAGRPMSLSTVRRMYSFFSRHEVDKKGKDFYNTSNPSNGRIMWDAWGGDAGFSWSRSIVNRYAKKDIWIDSPLSLNKWR